MKNVATAVALGMLFSAAAFAEDVGQPSANPPASSSTIDPAKRYRTNDRFTVVAPSSRQTAPAQPIIAPIAEPLRLEPLLIEPPRIEPLRPIGT